MSNLHKFHTPCKKCYFAEYDSNTQTGCYMGLIDQYRQSETVEIVEAYDEEHEFYIINKKQCAGYREENYFKSRNLENASLEEKVAYVQDKLQLKYIAIINSVSLELETLSSILEELKKSDVNPSCIMVCVSEKSKYTFNDYYKVLNKSGIGCSWKIKYVQDPEQTHITTVHHVINLGAENCNFVLSIDGNYDNITEMINLGNDITYRKFDRFMVISNKEKTALLFNKFVYKSALAHSADIITKHEDYIIV